MTVDFGNRIAASSKTLLRQVSMTADTAKPQADSWIMKTRDAAPSALGPRSADREFFRRHPERFYRVRPAWVGEVAALGAKPPGPGLRPWIVVVRAGHDVRLRVPVGLPEDQRFDDTEAVAEAIAHQTPAPEMAERVRHALAADLGPAGGAA
jgi:hypothetical protein